MEPKVLVKIFDKAKFFGRVIVTTGTPAPTPNLPSYFLFEDGTIATTENNDNIEVNII